jgi:thymidine phosphorylase
MNDYLAKAILKLKPNSEFRFENNDYSTIEWYKIEGKKPTLAEIDNVIEQIKANEITEINAKATAKAELLKRLGITEEEAQLLLS